MTFLLFDLAVKLDGLSPKFQLKIDNRSPMSSAANPTSVSSSAPKVSQESGHAFWMVLTPYLVAIVAQIRMLMLYYDNTAAQPHYKPILIALAATIGIALMRWPFAHENPFRRSLTSDILLVAGLGASVFGTLFVGPWWVALSFMLIVTSLLARTVDRETLETLWPCALPLYVYLALPMRMDIDLITTLQRYSAMYTSRLLDLAGLGHHMNGTVINVPSLKEYGIEQACSGVQSFFTLLLVAVVFVVLARRIKAPSLGVSILSLMAGAVLLVAVYFSFEAEWVGQLLLFIAAGFFFYAFVGFRAAALILSAVFWAVFMNTIRILTIPLADYFMDVDLSSGFGHQALGYFALVLGIVMIMSTDQFLLFLFGPVEDSGESGPFGRLIRRLWNSMSRSNNDEESSTRRRNQPTAITPAERGLVWVVAGLIAVAGIWQVVDAERCRARADKGVRFFDEDPTVEFGQEDLPVAINDWKRDEYKMDNRSRGSDLGERSDSWEFRSASGIKVIASLDQPFPGWHELTTCYKNTGWKLLDRVVLTPAEAVKGPTDVTMEVPGLEDWGLIQAEFERPTGERAFLLFSHFDSFGEGLTVPEDWGTINSLFTRAANRLSHRIRASLLRGEAYQVQVFMTSVDELDDSVKQEVRQKYLIIRDNLRTRFLEKMENDQE